MRYLKTLKRLFLILALFAVSFPALSVCNLVGGSGTWYKGLSTAGATITPTISFTSTSGTSGIFNINWALTFNQGVKNYYTAPDGVNWSRNNLVSPDADTFPFTQSGCSAGFILWGKLGTASVGGGTVSASWQDTGTNEYQIYNTVRSAPQFYSTGGSYMAGLESEPVFSPTKNNVKVSVYASGVRDGTYAVSVPLNTVALSVWFMTGSNYWDRTDPSGGVPYNNMLSLNFTVRVSGGTVVNPTTSCSVVTPAAIDHSNVSANAVANNTKTGNVTVSCNGRVSGDVSLSANSNTTGFTLVDMKNGLISQLSVANSASGPWTRTISNKIFNNGNNTLYLKSILQQNGSATPSAGAHSGSAVITVSLY